MAKVKENYTDYIPFEAMENREWFNMMEDFVSLIADKNTRLRFADAIGYRKPFQNFKQLLQIHPELHSRWFAHKNQHYIEFVQEQIDSYNELEEA